MHVLKSEFASGIKDVTGGGGGGGNSHWRPGIHVPLGNR